MKKQISMLIPLDLFQRLRKHCFDLEIPMVAFVTRAIVELLRKEERVSK